MTFWVQCFLIMENTKTTEKKLFQRKKNNFENIKMMCSLFSLFSRTRQRRFLCSLCFFRKQKKNNLKQMRILVSKGKTVFETKHSINFYTQKEPTQDIKTC